MSVARYLDRSVFPALVGVLGDLAVLSKQAGKALGLLPVSASTVLLVSASAEAWKSSSSPVTGLQRLTRFVAPFKNVDGIRPV